MNNSDFFHQKIVSTYFYLRLYLGMSAILFGLALYVAGKIIFGLELQGSMSAYYHSGVRNLFVGVLVAAGFGMYLYKGYSWRENIALNVAGVCAVGVAFMPMSVETASTDMAFQKAIGSTSCNFICYAPFTDDVLHYGSAVILFACLAYVIGRLSKESLVHLESDRAKRNFGRIYNFIGLLMILLPISIYIMRSQIEGRNTSIFWLEYVLLFFFGLYWLLKTYELHLTHYEEIPKN